jgi:nitrite reductase/ring-hydroxylating ferredoxin subunit
LSDSSSGPVRVGPESDLGPDEARLVDVGVDARGLRRQAIVVRGPNGVPRAWLNQCRHLPIPLGVGTGAVLTDDRVHLICRTHGALYRRDDGFCIEGPCAGTWLRPFGLERDAHGVLWIVEAEDDATP